MANYESEHTKFMREYMEKHPEEAVSQQVGRAAWWDKDQATRTPPEPPRHSPKAGGNEYTFEPLSEKDQQENS